MACSKEKVKSTSISKRKGTNERRKATKKLFLFFSCYTRVTGRPQGSDTATLMIKEYKININKTRKGKQPAKKGYKSIRIQNGQQKKKNDGETMHTFLYFYLYLRYTRVTRRPSDRASSIKRLRLEETIVRTRKGRAATGFK